MIYAYLRVSTDDQDASGQRQGVDQFAKNHNWAIDEYIIDNGVSGAKDPSKRRLGELMDKLKKDDVIICSEISRLGRDLYMVMNILQYAMKINCKIYTVKDNFVLGDDIQSKVLAFAFGLSAEIERQMIKQRTREGLMLKVKKGVLLGRPPSAEETPTERISEADKPKIIEQYNWGVPISRLAKNFNVHRITIGRYLSKWKVSDDGSLYKRFIEKNKKRNEEIRYKDEKYDPAQLDKNKCRKLIQANLTIPEIAEHFEGYKYEQIYDAILLDHDLNALYREYGQKIAKRK